MVRELVETIGQAGLTESTDRKKNMVMVLRASDIGIPEETMIRLGGIDMKRVTQMPILGSIVSDDAE
eukprot:11377425-Karenia_brevis.AAC.1